MKISTLHFEAKHGMLSMREKNFLVENVFRANGEYNNEVKKGFLERLPTSDLPHRNVDWSPISEFRKADSVHDPSRSDRPLGPNLK